MKRRLAFVAIATVLGVFLTAVLGISRGWYREKIGSFGITGYDYTGLGRTHISCTFDIYVTRKTDNPEKKGVKIFVRTKPSGFWSTKDPVDLETTMSLGEWDDFVNYINLIDKRLHEIWSER